MACPSPEHPLVIYLIMVVVTTIQVIDSDVQLLYRLARIGANTEVTQLALSLTINIYATSIIALKAWCVCFHGISGNNFVDRASIDDTTCAYVHTGNTASC
jgi:hypothetical protein